MNIPKDQTIEKKCYSVIPHPRINNQILIKSKSRSQNTVTETILDQSRLQFALTAIYHFLFLPLTLGLPWILVTQESAGDDGWILVVLLAVSFGIINALWLESEKCLNSED